MDEQRQDDQQEPIYDSSVPMQDIALKTSQERWTIETNGENGSGRSVLAARHDDDDDDDDIYIYIYIYMCVYIYLYIYIYVCVCVCISFHKK